jgi:hypothetical protein
MVPSQLLGGPHQLLKAFRFQIDGTNDPNFQVPAGAVSDVVRDSTGLFSITLPVGERPPILVSVTGNVQQATAASTTLALVVVPVSYTASTGVLVVRTEGSTGVADDPEDDAWVHIQAVFALMTLGTSTGAIPA